MDIHIGIFVTEIANRWVYVIAGSRHVSLIDLMESNIQFFDVIVRKFFLHDQRNGTTS